MQQMGKDNQIDNPLLNGHYKSNHLYFDTVESKSGYGHDEGNYIDGQRDGEWKSFDKRNFLFKIHNYKKGTLVGQTITWSQSTHLIIKKGYYNEKGNREGTWEFYEHDGTPALIKTYRDGLSFGLEQLYYSNGEIKLETIHIL